MSDQNGMPPPSRLPDIPEQADVEMDYSARGLAQEDFVLPELHPLAAPWRLQHSSSEFVPQGYEPLSLQAALVFSGLNNTTSMPKAPGSPQGNIPGAWPPAVSDGESSQKIVPFQFIPVDAVVEKRPPLPTDNGPHRASPAYSTGYEGVRQSPAYSLGFQSARESPATSVGYGNVRQSPAYSLGFQSARTSPAYSMGYVSARVSPYSVGGYYSAKQSPFETFGPPPRQSLLAQQTTSEYMDILGQKGLLPSVEEELNWSGRPPSEGQHVEFSKREKVPLEEIGIIGASLTAKITKVKCRRIVLAKKSMVCGFHLKLEDALNEVQHLQRLRHAHIVRLVGSYLQGRNFSILIYPVAEYDLSTFMEHVATILQNPEPAISDYLAPVSLGQFFSCLAEAMAYIHLNTTKHMDIKPQNILVKIDPQYSLRHRVFIADFGISRHFSSLDHSQTDSEIAKSPKYCAPEVYAEENWGRSADVFSLGCVFLEMQTVLCHISLDEFVEFRSKISGRESFQFNLPLVHEWIDGLGTNDPFVVFGTQELKKERKETLLSEVRSMLSSEPELRPSAFDIAYELSFYGSCRIRQDCCRTGQGDFQSEPPQAELRKDVKDLENYQVNSLFTTAVSNGCSAMRRKLSAAYTIRDKDISELLRIAVTENDESAVIDLLEVGAKFGYRKSSISELAIVAAARQGHEALLGIMLDTLRTSDDEPNVPKTRDHALEIAFHNNLPGIARLLITHGAEFNGIMDESRTTALHAAAANGHDGMVELLLDVGANCEDEDTNGYTALHHAASQGQSSSVEILLNSGATFDSINHRGQTPLLLSTTNGLLDVVELLLDAGADVNASCSQSNGPLHAAARNGHDNIVSLLLAKGADPRAQNAKGETALHVATVQNHCLVASLLISKAPDLLEALDISGWSPLRLAVTYHRFDMTKFLLDQGAQVDSINIKDNGDTPLFVAVASRNQDLAKLLLDRGADPNSMNILGETPLHTAVFSKNEGLVTLFLENGARPDIAGLFRGTPVDIARNDGFYRISELLSRYSNKASFS